MESNNYSSVLKNNLILLRRNAKMTQEQFAEKLGLSFQAVSKWENGLSCPDITLLPQIAQIYGVTIDQLFAPMAAEDFEKPAGESAQGPESEASKAQRAYYGDIHLDEALSYLSQKAQQVGAAVGQSASDFARTAQRMAKAAWAAREESACGNGEQGILISGLPWENDGLYRGVVYRGRKQVTEAVVDRGEIPLPEECGDLCTAFSLYCETIEGDVRYVSGPLKVTGCIEGDVIQCAAAECDNAAGDVVQCSTLHCAQWEGERIYGELPDGRENQDYRSRHSSHSAKPLGDIPADGVCRALLFRGQVLLTVPAEDGAALVSYASPEELARFSVQGENVEGDLRFALGGCTAENVEGDVIQCSQVTVATVEGDIIQCDAVTCHSVEGDVVQCREVTLK